MRIIITGASGNVGTALLRRLASTKHDVVGVARHHPGTSKAYESASWVLLDVADPAADLVGTFRGADAVIHLAWLIQPSRDVDELVRINVDGTRAVARAAAAAGVGHLVVASSVGVYGHHPDDHSARTTETWPLKAVASLEYSRSKVANEAFLDDFERDHSDLVVTRVRPGLVLQHDAGSEIAKYFVGPLLPTGALLRVPLPVMGMPRGLAVQAVHADDLADAYVKVVEARLPGALNVAAEPVLTGRLVAQALGARRVLPLGRSLTRTAAALTYRAHVHPTAPGWLDMAYAVPVMDTNRARSELGWEPQTSALDALTDLLQGARDHAGTSSAPLKPRRAPQRAGATT